MKIEVNLEGNISGFNKKFIYGKITKAIRETIESNLKDVTFSIEEKVVSEKTLEKLRWLAKREAGSDFSLNAQGDMYNQVLIARGILEILEKIK